MTLSGWCSCFNLNMGTGLTGCAQPKHYGPFKQRPMQASSARRTHHHYGTPGSSRQIYVTPTCCGMGAQQGHTLMCYLRTGCHWRVWDVSWGTTKTKPTSLRRTTFGQRGEPATSWNDCSTGKLTSPSHSPDCCGCVGAGGVDLWSESGVVSPLWSTRWVADADRGSRNMSESISS